MIELERAMMEDCRIDLVQMMENAGRNPAQLARTRFLAGDPRGKRVVVLPAMRATATLTLALPKAGLRAPGVAAQADELCLADTAGASRVKVANVLKQVNEEGALRRQDGRYPPRPPRCM